MANKSEILVKITEQIKNFVALKLNDTELDGETKSYYENIRNAIEQQSYSNLIDLISKEVGNDLDPVTKYELYSFLHKIITTSDIQKVLLYPTQSENETKQREPSSFSSEQDNHLGNILEMISKMYDTDTIFVPRKYTQCWEITTKKIETYPFIHYIYPLIVANDELYYVSSGRPYISSMNLFSQEIRRYGSYIDGKNDNMKHIIWNNTIFIFTLNKDDIIKTYSIDLCNLKICAECSIVSNISLKKIHIQVIQNSVLFVCCVTETCLAIPIKTFLKQNNTIEINFPNDPKKSELQNGYTSNAILLYHSDKSLIIMDGNEPGSAWNIYNLKEYPCPESKNHNFIENDLYTSFSLEQNNNQILCPVPHKTKQSENNTFANWLIRMIMNIPATIHEQGVTTVQNNENILCLGYSRAHKTHQLYLCDLKDLFQAKAKIFPIIYEAIDDDVNFDINNTYTFVSSQESNEIYMIEWKMDVDLIRKYPIAIYQLLLISREVEQQNKDYLKYIQYTKDFFSRIL